MNTHAQSTSIFGKYSAFYDLLYRDKNYATEAAYVGRVLRDVTSDARSLLEFGSGTGRHGRLLAEAGFDVHGIEYSAEMVALANAVPQAVAGGGSFTCELGDVRVANVGRTFDAVIALFHVIGYQATNDDLLAAFRVAVKHLTPGGIFFFDVWHGPAVLTERPSKRVRRVADVHHHVKRTARPRLDSERSIVKVTYDMECTDRRTRETARFTEEHVMRYLFPTEINLLARASGLQVLRSEEFLTGRPPSSSTWSVAYMLRKS